MKKTALLFFLGICLWQLVTTPIVLATDCYKLLYYQTDSFTSDYRWAEDQITFTEATGALSITSSTILNGPHTWNNYQYAIVRMTAGGWTSHVTGSFSLLAGVSVPGTQDSDWSSTHLNVAYPVCGTPPNPCEGKQGQDGATVYTNLPYDALTYEQTGICDDGCVAKPATGPILNSYASDGSGYIIGPWTYTGEQCETGVTSELPPQPPQENNDDAGKNACQDKCAGRAYQYDPITGECECFGAPGTIDPPLEPTVPTPDPGSPSIPGAQTPTPDPGGDPQLGAQIANQAKQIGQGDAQLGQLGGINNKLSAVIGNQAKQLGQGDKILDYQRRQLGALEDIRNELAEDDNGEAPGLPDQPELDGSIPDTKNWTEYDDAEAIGQAQGQKQIDIIEGAQSDSPFSFGLNTSGADPCLSGPMFGRQIDICFNRPWMLTGYAIMNGITISVGYLQAFLMIQKVVTGA